MLPDVKISGIELSDLFFNYPNNNDYTTRELARSFLSDLPMLKAQGITEDLLVEDYYSRL